MSNLDYKSFLEWALMKEPALKIIEPLSEPNPDGFYNDKDINRSYGISDYTYNQTFYAFEEALNKYKPLSMYLGFFYFKMLVFNYALHTAIVNSSFEVKLVKEEGEEKPILWNEPDEELQKLYYKYGVYDATVGIVTSSSSGGSSSSSSLPKSVSEGDLETSYLLSTPYGIQAESILEQMNGIII